MRGKKKCGIAEAKEAITAMGMKRYILVVSLDFD
jgi:hypothetical protein